MKGLTTHVLDTVQGQPAVGVRVELWSCLENGSEAKQLGDELTNQEGRAMMAEHLGVGVYEIRFFIADYFAKTKMHDDKTVFLGVVPVRFCVRDSEEHYHVPLVVSPYSYSTYKGGAPKTK